MSASERHLRVYNRKQEPTETYFPQFTRLPLDLRLCIWEYALPKERFLQVRLIVEQRAKRVAPSESGQADDDYQVTLEGRKFISKFLHVCQEARRVALKFYRVRMPCRYQHGDTTKNGTLYFNPEDDIVKLSVSSRRKDYSPTIQFFKDLRSADPHGVGLQNLAMDVNGVNSLAGFQLDSMMPDARETLISMLSKLRKVYFLCLETTGRMFLGPLNGVRAITGFEMHRSRPVLGCVPAFQRIPMDPRPIERDLTRMFLGTYDPLHMLYTWKQLLKTYHVEASSDTEYSWMVSCSPKVPAAITDRASAEQWIAKEDAEWQAGLEEWDQRLGPGNVQREQPDDLCNAPQTAIGFWLFPIQALGELPSDEKPAEELERHFKPKRVADVSAYKPELGLMEI